MGKKRTAPTQGVTSARQPRPGQVTALRRLPNGPVYHLPDLAGGDVKWLTLGSSDRCDLVLTAPAQGATEAAQVEPVHCSLRCTADLVTIEPYAQAAKTEINKVAVVEGHAELRPGNVLTIGPIHLVACGENMKQHPDITAASLGEMIQQAQELHGTPYRTAGALGVKLPTYYRWVRGGKFAALAVAVFLLAGSTYWVGRSSTRPERAPTLPAMAAPPVSASPQPEPEPTPPVQTTTQPEPEPMRRPIPHRDSKMTSNTHVPLPTQEREANKGQGFQESTARPDGDFPAAYYRSQDSTVWETTADADFPAAYYSSAGREE